MRKLIFLSIFSILFGGGIYIAFRTTGILFFRWLDYLLLIEPIESLREVTLTYRLFLPNWFLYCLPDGLWMFSYSCIVLVIWDGKITKNSLFWLISLPLISVFCEILQYYHYINGTFDMVDIILFIFGSLLPIFINQKMKNEKSI